ncbi:hypothetical protein AGMMS49975_06040 [Clostridia bacterium]|nr:hypothetical protein AGMMS49975_06040 [Clostridia bacterium]
MEIVKIRVSDVIPYENNPRINTDAVMPLADSIRSFGFNSPVILDKDKVIICGHTRLLAAQILGIEEIPCIIAADLTPEQVKAYRIYDNRVADFSKWDKKLLEEEIESIDNYDVRTYFRSDFKFYSNIEDDESESDDIFTYDITFTSSVNFEEFRRFLTLLTAKFPELSTNTERFEAQIKEWA